MQHRTKRFALDGIGLLLFQLRVIFIKFTPNFHQLQSLASSSVLLQFVAFDPAKC